MAVDELVERLRGNLAHRSATGWSLQSERDVLALCDEVERLRAESALMRGVLECWTLHFPDGPVWQDAESRLFASESDARALCELLGYDPTTGERREVGS